MDESAGGISEVSEPKVWWLMQGHDKIGPFCREELRQMLCSGKMLATDQLWKEGLQRPVPVSAVHGLLSEMPHPAVASSAAESAPLSENPCRQETAGRVKLRIRLCYGIGFIVSCFSLLNINPYLYLSFRNSDNLMNAGLGAGLVCFSLTSLFIARYSLDDLFFNRPDWGRPVAAYLFAFMFSMPICFELVARVAPYMLIKASGDVDISQTAVNEKYIRSCARCSVTYRIRLDYLNPYTSDSVEVSKKEYDDIGCTETVTIKGHKSRLGFVLSSFQLGSPADNHSHSGYGCLTQWDMRI